MSRIDSIIDRDLAALGENSRRDIPSLDEVPALHTTDAYRDDRPGAEARRNALADERRRELVLMPLALAHVFAHRWGRIAAGAMALVVSGAMVLLMTDPLLMRFAAWFVPGLNLGMLIALAALKVLGAYVVATWIAEAWFARRMRKAVETGDDAYRDIDHLARGPLEIAQRAVKRIDGWSIGLFLAGIASVTLAFGYAIAIVGANHTLAHAWSITGIVDSGVLQRNIGTVVLAIAAACATAAVVGRACGRDAVGESPIAKGLSSWLSLVVAGVVALVLAYNAFHAYVGYRGAAFAAHEARYAFALGATISIFLPAAWALLFWRRREQARISL